MKKDTWKLAKQMIDKNALWDFSFESNDFCAKAKDENWNWHYGYLLQEEHNGTSYCIKIISRYTSWWNGITSEHNDETTVIPETVCVSSGIRDKNDSLIYAGDIVKLSNLEIDKERKGYVYYRNGCFWLKLERAKDSAFLYSYNNDFLEVVGNIFDIEQLNAKQMFGG